MIGFVFPHMPSLASLTYAVDDKFCFRSTLTWLLGLSEEFRPISCTPHGIVVLLAMHGVRVVGQTAVVIGKSRMVGAPTAAMLSSGGATVTMCDVHTERTTLERKVNRCWRRAGDTTRGGTWLRHSV